MITQTIPGTWAVHELDKPPVEGIAVWKYRWGWECEECGPSGPINTKPECVHIKKVKDYETKKNRCLSYRM